MAVRQYVGARYVPKIANPAEWNSTLQYEALTIVTHLGNSFTSRKPVPAGIDISNTDYWVNTGNYNAQVEQYRQETEAVAADVTALTGNLGTLTTTVSGIRTDVDALTTEVTNNQNSVEQVFVNVKDFGAVGDGQTDDTQAFIQAFAGGKKRIEIPYGRYKITSSITIGSSTTVNCRGVILHTLTSGRYNATFKIESVGNIYLSGISFLGTGAMERDFEFTTCICCRDVTNIVIDQCSFTDVQSANAVMIDHCNRVLIKGCLFNHYSRAAIAVQNTSNEVYVVENYIYDGKSVDEDYLSYGIILSSFDSGATETTPMGRTLVATGNFLYNRVSFWEGIDAHGGKNVLIFGNAVYGFRVGIGIFEDRTHNLTLSDCKVIGNVIENGTDRSYSRAGNNACLIVSGLNCTVIGNTCKNGGKLTSSGTQYFGALYVTDTEDAIISNNVILDCKGSVMLMGPAKRVKFCNNIVTNQVGELNTYAKEIVTARTNPNVSDIFVENNYIQGTNMEVVTHASITNPYFKFKNNELVGFSNDGVYDAIVDQNNVGSVKTGHVGDIIMRKTPVVGQPIGWICTTAWVNGAGGAWTPLPNLTA